MIVGYQSPGNNYEKNIAFIEYCLKKDLMDIIAKPE
jgi:hypothetical protein